jgi:multisubunit Na+/H+ antiporter MnhB subunit
VISLTQLVYWVFGLLICAAVVGLLIIAVRKAPFVPAEWKPTIEGVVWVVSIFILILALLSLLGGRPLVVL